MKEPVTLHVRMFIQGHHKHHSTEFILTSEGGSPDRSEDVISRITYPVGGVQRDFVDKVAEEMDTVLVGTLSVHPPEGWVDHVSYRGYREVSES
jgi:hypothetical protein